MPDLKFLEVFFTYHFQRRNSVSPTDGAAQTGGSTPCGVTWDSSRTVVVIKLRRTSALLSLLQLSASYKNIGPHPQTGPLPPEGPSSVQFKV